MGPQKGGKKPARWAEGKGARGDDTVAYVCRNRTCSAPVSDVTALEGLLDRG